MSFKIKRVLAAIISISTMVALGTISAYASYASQSKIVKPKNTSVIDISVDAYVDFLLGPLLYEDRIYYTSYLSGPDINLVYNTSDTSCYIEPKTDKKTLSKIYLNANNPTANNTNGAKCGYGGSYGQLTVKVADNTDTLTDWDSN